MKPLPQLGLRYLDDCIEQLPAFARYAEIMAARLRDHGDVMRWEAAVSELEQLSLHTTNVEYGATVTAAGAISVAQRAQLKTNLQALKPWRKGPFNLYDIQLDTEWRSDWKWQRLRKHLPTLADARILDVGCGNGYYGWRMLEAGAREVLGIDPTLVFLYQHLAASIFLGRERNRVLPLSFEEMTPAESFDVVFSMGVLYHRRDPLAHLKALKQYLTRGGTLVLETLISLDGDIEPTERYAKMRNVHCVPTPERVLSWLHSTGLEIAAPCDITTTSIAEQRATEWMSFESLVNTLDPTDPTRTVEGYPAPVRACFVARLG